MSSPPNKNLNNMMASPRARAHPLKTMNTFPTKAVPTKKSKKKKNGTRKDLFLYDSSQDEMSTIRSIYMDESVGSLNMSNSIAGQKVTIENSVSLLFAYFCLP